MPSKAAFGEPTSFMEAREFVAQGDRVLVIGFAMWRIKATNRTWEDYWVFAITVRNDRLTNIREYIDMQALARAAEMAEKGSENAFVLNENVLW